jgi:UDP-glucuronate 4-epimerase
MMSRDFTYIDYTLEGIMGISDVPLGARTIEELDDDDPLTSATPYRICNIGRNELVELDEFIKAIKTTTQKRATRNNLPIQPGDVHLTCADVSTLQELTDFQPKIGVQEGVRKFVDWFAGYYVSKKP